MEATELYPDWGYLSLSYAVMISVFGIHTAVQLIETWRVTPYTQPVLKRFLLLASSMSFGACGVWCMHFAAMLGLRLPELDGTTQVYSVIRYDGWIAVVSFLVCVSFIYAGVVIASHDPYFEITQEQAMSDSMESMRVKKEKPQMLDGLKSKMFVDWDYTSIALLSKLQYVLVGGVVAGVGIVVMISLALYAQMMQGIQLEWYGGFMAVATFMTCTTCSFAFWVIFRMLNFYYENEFLRAVCALFLGIMIGGTYMVIITSGVHYIIKPGHHFEIDEYVLVFEQVAMGRITSQSSMIVCYLFLASFASRMQTDTRRRIASTKRTRKSSKIGALLSMKNFGSKKGKKVFVQNTFAIPEEPGTDRYSSAKTLKSINETVNNSNRLGSGPTLKSINETVKNARLESADTMKSIRDDAPQTTKAVTSDEFDALEKKDVHGKEASNSFTLDLHASGKALQVPPGEIRGSPYDPEDDRETNDVLNEMSRPSSLQEGDSLRSITSSTVSSARRRSELEKAAHILETDAALSIESFQALDQEESNQ